MYTMYYLDVHTDDKDARDFSGPISHLSGNDSDEDEYGNLDMREIFNLKMKGPKGKVI